MHGDGELEDLRSSIPSFDHFIEPLLFYLAKQREPVPTREAHERVADALGLTKAQKRVSLENGQPIYKNRCGWAHDRLKRAGLSHSIRRGYWAITDEGRAYLQRYPNGLTPEEVRRIATQNIEMRLGAAQPREKDGSRSIASEKQDRREALATTSPHEQLEAVLSDLRRKVGEDLLDALHGTSPAFFEIVVLDLLHRMGYGASREDLERVGGSGDGGIDGIISLDKLGLEKVYVQAKRWQNQTVSRQEIQAFYGALAGKKATKGVFITTSAFSRHAKEFADAIEGIVLIDGARLVSLMIDYEVGVSTRTIKLAQLDSDYFDEDSI